jgi:shikimate dehydrogenase
MLVAQAALSFELWFGVTPDLANAHARARALLEATQ